LALVQMSLVEQRYRAVLAVRAGDRVNEVAARFGVSRQSEQGLAGLENRSHRPDPCPHPGPRTCRNHEPQRRLVNDGSFSAVFRPAPLGRGRGDTA
jgi:hypothetical protein